MPVVHPYQRGSRDAAAAVRTESALAKADEEFQEDKFAKTSRGPRESRWKLWCSLAERSLPPLPITVELIDKVGALFKQARYRSAAQYYSVAISLNTDLRGTTGPQLSTMRSRKQSGRSPGGVGPSSAKLDFPLEACARSFEQDVEKAYVKLQLPESARIEAPADTGIVAAWCLVKLELPISKNDPTATGCHRTHACICLRRHDPGCSRTGDEALFVYSVAAVQLFAWATSPLRFSCSATVLSSPS